MFRITMLIAVLTLTTSTVFALPLPTDPTLPGPMTPDQPRLGVRGFVAQNGGLQIVDVLDNYPAKDAGLEVGDVILTMDGTVVAQPNDINALLDRVMTDKQGQLTMVVRNHRDGKFYNINANLVTIQYNAVVQSANGAQKQVLKQKIQAQNVQVKPIRK